MITHAASRKQYTVLLDCPRGGLLFYCAKGRLVVTSLLLHDLHSVLRRGLAVTGGNDNEQVIGRLSGQIALEHITDAGVVHVRNILEDRALSLSLDLLHKLLSTHIAASKLNNDGVVIATGGRVDAEGLALLVEVEIILYQLSVCISGLILGGDGDGASDNVIGADDSLADLGTLHSVV